MTKARIRKRKKKKSKEKKSNKVFFKKDGLKIVRKGERIFFENNRTAEEHDKFIENVRRNRPSQLENIKRTVDRVDEIFAGYDNIQLLGALAYNHILNDLNPQDDGLSEVTLELGMSFATAKKNTLRIKPSPDIINELIAQLVAIRHDYNAYAMTETVEGKYKELEGALRFKVILEALYLRGDGYTEHIYSVFVELFSGHDDFFRKQYGFTSKEILDTILQLENSFCCRLVLPGGHPHPACHTRYVEWIKIKPQDEIENSQKHFIDQFGDDNPDLIIQDKKIHSYRIDDISSYETLFKIRFRFDFQKKVVEAISQEFGDNYEFLNPKFKGLPLNDSLITTKPIIKNNGDYFIFAFALPTRNLFNITEHLILRADINYYNTKYLGKKYSLSRDNYLEAKTADLFKKIIPNSVAYPNCIYKPLDKNGNEYNTELDLLLISDKAIYLIEMKAGGISAPAKRGAVKSLTGNLKESVGYGAFQNFRALEYILNSNTPQFITEGGTTVTVDKNSKFFRITITLEHLADLIAYMYDLKEIGVIDKNIDFAWTCSIFDLIIFSEIIETEADFIDYLEKRIPLYKRSELYFKDEIDLLGYFLEYDLEFNEKVIKGLTSFQLHKFSTKIDDYFERKGAKPKRKRISN